MNDRILKITLEGQTWYQHQGPDRINNRETAVRLTKDQAEKLAEHFRRVWKAETEIIEV